MSAPQPASMGNQTFVKAKDDFLASLSAAEKAQFAECSTARELLNHDQKMDIISKTKRRGMPLFRTIKNFSDKLSPYFKIIETLCSSPSLVMYSLGCFPTRIAACKQFCHILRETLYNNREAGGTVAPL